MTHDRDGETDQDSREVPRQIMTRRTALRTIGGALATALAPCSIALAQTQQAYPWRAIRIVVPLPPGGNVDIIARGFAQRLTAALGQQVLVDNKGGAGTVIGSEAVARSEPDGHTLLVVGAGNLTVNPALFKKLPYDTERDFAPVSVMAQVPLILVVHPSLPVSTVGELIAYARQRPGEINLANGSTGSAGHLAGELFMSMSGTRYQSIPYKGNAPALADTVAGHMMMMFDTLSTALPYVRSGRLRAIAVTGGERSPLLPQTPTVAESGLPGYEATVTICMLAPGATPAAVVQRLSTEVARIARAPEIRAQFAEQGIDLVGSTPEACADFVRTDIAKWRKVIQEAGIKPE